MIFRVRFRNEREVEVKRGTMNHADSLTNEQADAIINDAWSRLPKSWQSNASAVQIDWDRVETTPQKYEVPQQKEGEK